VIDLVSSANARIAALKCPLHTLAVLTDIPLSEVSRILSRKIESNERTLRIDQALTSLEHLAAIADPIPLNLRDGQRLKRVIELVEHGEMRVIVLGDLIGD